MQISNRIKRFIKKTNSFCIIMEEGEPSYIFASFDWAEQMLIPQDAEVIENINDDISLVAVEDKVENLAPDDENL